MEISTEVATFRVDLRCDICQVGVLEECNQAGMLATHPPQYLHKCNKCEYQTYVIGKRYPLIEYRKKEK